MARVSAQIRKRVATAIPHISGLPEILRRQLSCADFAFLPVFADGASCRVDQYAIVTQQNAPETRTNQPITAHSW